MYRHVGLCRDVYGYVGLCMAIYGYVWLGRHMYGYLGLCMAVSGYVFKSRGMYVWLWLCMATYGYVGLCKAMENNVYHILTSGEPLYDAYTTYLPTQGKMSHNVLNQSRKGKNPFFKFIRPGFWTDLNSCRQRLLFVRHLIPRKSSLCSQGIRSVTVITQVTNELDYNGH